MDSDQLILASVLPEFTPDKTVLLVIDKQGAYFDPALLKKRHKSSQETVLGRIDAFIELCRQKQIPIIWTQMVEDKQLSPPNISLKMTVDEKAYPTPLVTATPGKVDFDFFGLKPTKEETVIRKYNYDAFAQTNLSDVIQKSGTTSVIITGGFTSRCILGTAYGANGHGLHVWVPRDLVTAPHEFDEEIPGVFSIINAVLGYSYESQVLVDSWS